MPDHGRALRLLSAITGEQWKDVADRLGVDPSYVSMVKGDRRTPSGAFLATMAHAYGLTGEQLDALAQDRPEPGPMGDALVAAVEAAGRHTRR